MELPVELRTMSERVASGLSGSDMLDSARNLSHRYMTESGTGKSLLTEEREAVVYSLMRMPATYGAVSSALEQICQVSDFVPRSLLDVGAGTGAGSWAANSYFLLDSITCLERERAMETVGKSFMEGSSEPVLQQARWIRKDISTEFSGQYSSDLVIASYVLNEMSEADRLKTVQQMWDNTKQMLLIVEPGTPVGSANIRSIRQYLLEQGAYVVAPCPHQSQCPVSGDDWCHFTCRVQRSKLHKLVKDGDVPYEDEKFSYIAVSRTPHKLPQGRIMRHPMIQKGKIGLTLCQADGYIRQLEVLKKDTESYKQAKKSACGDAFSINHQQSIRMEGV